MNNTTRRVFFMQVAAGTSALAVASQVMAEAAIVSEKDPTAISLGYVADSTKADAKKFPKHVATQNCSNCALYAGKPGEAHGPCPLYAGKLVSAKGWCSAYNKKAA
jgi:hypothetical protein